VTPILLRAGIDTMTTAIGRNAHRLRAATATLLAFGAGLAMAAPIAGDLDLLELSLEQLGDVEVTSVSRRSEKLSDAPASVFVIQHDDIQRSGASTLPEVLRLAPNLAVARVSASSYAISARGFNNSLGNKLLVLIDGRTVYTPLFSGVFWDAQDVLLEDIERIEVISGPGATLWGANAVNGVINVITRSATSTRGSLLGFEAGSDGHGALVRHGGRLGSAGNYRVYAKQHDIDATHDADGAPLPDGWTRRQAGFRADWGSPGSGLTVQGDNYDANSVHRPGFPIAISGTNLLAAWSRRSDHGSSLQLQAWFDRTERDDKLLFHDRMDVFDLELRHGVQAGRHEILWGAGYRHASDEVERGFLATFVPGKRDLSWANVFVQDEIRVRDALHVTAGLRLDRNVYTGIEVLPSTRISWTPSPGRLWWGAASRAVRAPSRIDREFFFPGSPPYLITGGPDFDSEVSNVFELGHRVQVGNAGSVSVTLFQHRHERLRSGEPQPDGTFQVSNGTEGTTSGIEAWADLQLAPRWRIAAGAVALRQRLRTSAGSNDPDGPVDLGNDPRHQWSLRSTFGISPTLDLNLIARRVGELPDPRIDAYEVVDLTLGWRPGARADWLLSVRDLFDSGHAEFAPGPLAARSEYDRSVSIRLLWRW
jgi:iron complex outermembrane recepter protein